MDWKKLTLLGCIVGLTGCRGSTIVLGNLTSMAIVVAMLWSTINMNRG